MDSLDVFVVAVIGPMLTAAIKRISWVDERLGTSIMTGLVALIYLAAWAAVSRDIATLNEWMMRAMTATGIGAVGTNVLRFQKRKAEDRLIEKIEEGAVVVPTPVDPLPSVTGGQVLRSEASDKGGNEVKMFHGVGP